LKEKVIAAHRAGIKTIVFPKENEKDLEEIPENIRQKINFVAVTDMDQVLATAFRS